LIRPLLAGFDRPLTPNYATKPLRPRKRVQLDAIWCNPLSGSECKKAAFYAIGSFFSAHL
jgi:hypothetical protein